MRKLLVAISVVLTSFSALAHAEFLSIPSSGFTPQSSDRGYSGNNSGTARYFEKSFFMFAPVNLPHRATVTSLLCGASTGANNYRIQFTLRRNEPQQANVNMATVLTTYAHSGFQFVSSNAVNAPVVDNATYNYYVVAELQSSTDEFPQCPHCSIGFCRVGYSD